MGNPIVDFFSACVTAWLVLYGSLLLMFDLWPLLTFSFGTVVPVLLFMGAWWLRIPPPSREVVNEILGPDPISGPPESGKYFMHSVAHRGAPLDAPENSITAFRKVKYHCWHYCQKHFLVIQGMIFYIFLTSTTRGFMRI